MSTATTAAASTMKSLAAVKVAARACCAVDQEVWVAKMSGGVAVYSLHDVSCIADIAVKTDGDTAAQVLHMACVWNEVWLGTGDGYLLFYDGPRRSCIASWRTPGADRRIGITGISLKGRVVAVGTDSGAVYLLDALLHTRLNTLSTADSPCSAVAWYHGFVVGGDRDGAVYLWDAETSDCLIRHGKSRSEVVCLHPEPTTSTIWVSRVNQNVDIYKIEGDELQLASRVKCSGRVTDMASLSGAVLLTTYAREIMTVALDGYRVIAKVSAAHDNCIRGLCKPTHREVAVVWTVGHDDTLRVWEMTGLPVASTAFPPPRTASIAGLPAKRAADYELEVAELKTRVAASQLSRSDLLDDLRRSREEAQEMRLRVHQKETELQTAEETLASTTKRLKVADEANTKLTQEMTKISSDVAKVERERTTLQAEVTQLTTDLSKSRTETNTKATEKLQVEQQLSQERTAKNILEQRVRDAEGRLAGLQLEHVKLCNSTAANGQLNVPSGWDLDGKDLLAKTNADLKKELTEARQLNEVLSSALASMEYTIRRHEEEDADLTTLLNAYRRKVAGVVSDAHISALLLATIARNAARFDLDCDEFTKARLMDHNGGFLQFLQTLRETDAEAYEKLIHYLQNPAVGGSLTAETRALMERFIDLAAKDGAVSDADVATFKRCIPSLQDAKRAGDTRQNGAGSINPMMAAIGATGDAVNGGAGGTTDPSKAAANSKVDDEVVHHALMQEVRSQRIIDENYIKEQEALFEFILKTRRMLVESLTLLYRRVNSARLVVEALSANRDSGSPILNASSPTGSSKPLPVVFPSIIREITALITDIVTRYFTGAEKQRSGIEV